jgi:hypothetical protein
MKLMRALFYASVVAGCAASLAAQTRETESKTKVTVKDGKSMTVIGCVAPATGGTGFVLTNVADKSGDLHDYTLVPEDEDVAKHVGHRVQINGKVTDRGDGKVEIERNTKTKVEHGDDKETRSKSEVKGDLTTPYLTVKSLKMIAATCR